MKSKQEYQKMVDELTPNSKLLPDCLKAFFSGGFICCLGQVITNYCVSIGFTKDTSSLITSISLICPSTSVCPSNFPSFFNTSLSS